jgi:secondary thiamine-phosphate synthase enzyme
MQQGHHRLTVPTSGQGLYDVTAPIRRWVADQKVQHGLLTVWCRHTSCSLLVQENADPDVRADLEAFFRQIAPEKAGLYRHDVEGPDDMPAHIRAALTTTSLGVPVEQGAMVLGTWQAIYLYEHRAAAHKRELVLHVIGDA